MKLPFAAFLCLLSSLAWSCGAPARVAEPAPSPKEPATAASAPATELAASTAIKKAADIPYGNPAAPPPAAKIPPDWIEHRAANPNPSSAYAWLEIVLEVTGRDIVKVGARPTIISRQMAIPMTAMYDAWAAYDEKAVGTRLGGKLRRPAKERTLKNKAKAISYATYRALVDIFPNDKDWLADKMRWMGYDPNDASTDTKTPQGIGNVAAAALLEYRRHDGANQFGEAVEAMSRERADER